MAHADLSPEQNMIHVLCHWNEKDIIKMVPGVRSIRNAEVEPGYTMWKLPLAWASMVGLRGVFGPHFTYSDELGKWTWNIRQSRIEPALALREALEWPEEGFQSGMYPFQRADVAFMEIAGSGLLGNEAGTGKTISVLAYMQRHFSERHPTLIVCPNSVKHHWKNKAKEWKDAAAQWDPDSNVYVIEKGTAGGRKILAQAKKDPNAVVIINIEAVHSFSRSAPYGSIKLKTCRTCDPEFGQDIAESRCERHPKELNNFGFKLVVLDEAHRFGQAKTMQTRAIWAVCHDPSVKHVWGLTGTPDSVKRLWTIMHAIAPDDYPVKSTWMERYALQSWNAWGGQDVVGFRPDTREEALRVLDPRFRRMIKAVVLPWLPPVVHTVRYAEMSPAQRKTYKELDDALNVRMPDGELYVAVNPMIARLRQMQFASSSLHVEKEDLDDISTWKVTLVEPSPKLDVFEEVLDELGDQSFVASAESRQLIELAAARLEKRRVRFSLVVGGISSEAQVQATEDLKKGVIQAILFTIKAGSVGLDMTGARNHIHLQRSWSLIENIQTGERTLRPGAEIHDSINHIDIITRDTREEIQVEKLLEKMAQLEDITRDKQKLGLHLANEGASLSPTEIVDISRRIQTLQAQEQRILAQDDIEQMMAEEEE